MASIQERGDSYLFTVSLGRGADGKYKRETTTYRISKEKKQNMTPKQLERHLEHEAYKFEQKVKSNAYIAPSAMTFKQFALNEWKIKWLEENVTENTIMVRISYLNNHILPIIGHMQISDITPLMLLDLMNNLTRKDGQKGDLSVSSKQEVHKTLVSIFKRAVEWRVIQKNPMEGIQLPRERKTNKQEHNVYDENEVKHIIQLLQKEPFHWRIFISLALSTGMRRSELLGLEWKHVSFKTGTISIKQIISKARKGLQIKSPKNDSFRIISLPRNIVGELKLYKEHCQNEKELYSDAWDDRNGDWLFYNINTGNHLYPDTPTTWWNRFLKRNKLRRIRLHDLRHTKATLLISGGVHEKIISERLGHRKTSTTMDIYSHVLPSADHRASEVLNDLFESK